MAQGNVGRRSGRAPKHKVHGHHGYGAVMTDAAFLRKLNGYLRPKSPMYSSVIEAFEAHRKQPVERAGRE